MAPKPRPSKKAKVESKFSRKYNTPDADVIIRCKSEYEPAATLFAVRRSVLVAASSVFEDIFALPQEGVAGGEGLERLADQQAPGDLAIVEVTDNSYALAKVLDLIHRQHIDNLVLDLRPEACVWEIVDIIDAMLVADKYDVPSAMTILCLVLENHVIVGEGCGGQGPGDRTHLDALAAAIILKGGH